jgi:hypothetical protein
VSPEILHREFTLLTQTLAIATALNCYPRLNHPEGGNNYVERVAEIDDRGHAFLSERSSSAT